MLSLVQIQGKRIQTDYYSNNNQTISIGQQYMKEKTSFYIIWLRNKDSFQFPWKFNYVTFRNTFWRESILHTKMDWLSRLTTFFDMKTYSILRVLTFKCYQILLSKRIRADEGKNPFIDIDSSSNDFISIMKRNIRSTFQEKSHTRKISKYDPPTNYSRHSSFELYLR